MKTSIKSLIAIAAFGATALFAPAQTLKVGTIDMNKALDGYWKTQEEQAVVKGYEQRATEGTERIMNEGRASVDKYREALDQANNTILTEEARKAAAQQAQVLLQEVQKKEQEIQAFRNQAVQTIQQQVATSRRALLEKITEVASAIAKKKGITLLVEKSNAAVITVVYADPGFDITDEVVIELNKDRPATAPAAAPAAPATTGTAPAINF
ncbi:MAG: OmpH family outer membrane protein [Opitutaceae bacterium]|jgi:outer membrane protein|nr:OmpH family outer membrane protein [Opitutaceae bacterium]